MGTPTRDESKYPEFLLPIVPTKPRKPKKERQLKTHHKTKSLEILGILVLLGMATSAFADDWFYGHPAPTVSPAVATKNWRRCVAAAAAQLDDHVSPVMDIASAIEPLCATKEDTAIDAINKDFLDNNPGIAANTSLTEMDRTRQEAHTSFRQTIGTIILALRKSHR